jgi:soluble lytic murein transglycosylase
MRHKKHHPKILRRIIVLLAAIIVLALIWKPVYRNIFLKSAYPIKYEDIVMQYSAENGLDPYLVYAVIRNESNFNPKAKSNIGALGLMQVTPSTFNWAMEKSGEKDTYTADDLYKPEVNVHYGTAILALFLKEFGNEETAVAAYHAGRGIVNKWLSDTKYSKDGKTLFYIPYDNTRTYVKRVEASKKIYTELYDKND